MIEVYPGLFVGNKGDCSLWGIKPSGNWATVHAYPPCHQQALEYRALAAPEGPEYAVARRDRHLFVKLIDAERPAYVHKETQIDPVLAFMQEMRAQGASILVHCEQGWSRSPSLALLYLATRLGVLPTASLATAEAQFKTRCPGYAPSYGMWAHMQQNWQQYCAEGRASRKRA